MTEKRFVDNGFEAIEDQSFTDTKTNKTYYVDYFDEIVDLVNQLNDENKVAIDWINFLQEKNAELKERNNRQASTIDNLYSLIEKEDWTGLKKIIEEIEEAEELNRLEFEAYCGDKDD